MSSTVAVPAVAQKPSAVSENYITISKKKRLENLDINGGARSNTWVNLLRASSPTNAKSLSPFSHDQISWITSHPSALDMFEEIMTASKGKHIVMFLDYDGTLSPIVDDPDRAFMSKAMRGTMRKLARYFPTAIVSGRCSDKVYNFVRLSELYYAGSHGMDIKGPPVKYKKKWIELAKQVGSVLEGYPCLRLTQGRKVLEIRPTIKWDKGKALEFLLESLGYDNCANVFPIYIGDDRTDEDAFKVLNERGQGFGILVSKTPKDTNASYSLQEPSEVMVFLRRLVEWKRLLLKRQFKMRRRLEKIKKSL